MPLYEYRCRACENVFEYMQGVSERPKRKCEACGGRLEKLVSRAGFVLKGTGWYETDFKGTKPKGDRGSTAKGDSASGDAGGSGSGDGGDSGSKDSGTKASKSRSGGAKKGGSSKED